MYTENQLTLAVLNRLAMDGYSDDDIDSMGEGADIFLHGYTLDTARHYDVQELSGLQMAGIGSKLKKAVKKVKKAVKKVAKPIQKAVRKVSKPFERAVKKVSRKILPDKIERFGKKTFKVAKGITRAAIAPMTLTTGLDTKKKVVQSITEARDVLESSFVPDQVYKAAKKFEQKHRPLLKQIAFTVAGVIASTIMGPGAMSFVQLATESIKQLAYDLASQKFVDQIIRVKAKRDQKEIDAEMAQIEREIAALQAELEPQIANDLQNVTPDMINAYLTPEQQEFIAQGLEANGETWLESPEAQQVLQPVIQELSARLAQMTSPNDLAPIAAANVASEGAKKPGMGVPLLIAASLFLL